jgi:AmiR/NasT family two-component response regulator
VSEPNGGEGSSVVAQASGMVSIQVGCSVADAIALMQQLAADTDCTLEEIAVLIVAGEARFD